MVAVHQPLTCFYCRTGTCDIREHLNAQCRDTEARRLREALVNHHAGLDYALAMLQGLCELWHGGQDTASYAYLSSGALTHARDAAVEILRDNTWQAGTEDALTEDQDAACRLVISIAEGEVV